MSAQAATIRSASILILDDEDANVRLLARILSRAGFTNLHTSTDSSSFPAAFAAASPDLILLDLHMPRVDGLGVLRQLRGMLADTDFLPVLAITGDATPDARQAVLTAGAKDFLAKPFDAAEVVVRAENLLTTRLLHRSLQRQNEELEHCVRERTSELQSALAAAESASRAKSRFLATMSHELRTPLNSVIGFSQHLLKNKAGNLSASDLQMLQRVADNGRSLLEIVNDVLDLARVEAGMLPSERTPVAIDRVALAALEGIVAANVIEDKAVTVQVTIPSRARTLLTDEGKFRRILDNLLANANKFTREGFIGISLVVDDAGVPLRLDVIDSGVGIPRERLDAIFAPFEQGESGTQRKFGGTGLGLAVARTLAELLGFRLSVVSDEGKGSAFSILLDPAAPIPASYTELVLQFRETPQMCA